MQQATTGTGAARKTHKMQVNQSYRMMDSAKRRDRVFRHVFKGSVLVSSLLDQHPSKFTTRAKAVKFAQRLLSAQHIESIVGHSTFEDSVHLYRWCDESVVEEARRLVSHAAYIPKKKLIELVELNFGGSDDEDEASIQNGEDLPSSARSELSEDGRSEISVGSPKVLHICRSPQTVRADFSQVKNSTPIQTPTRRRSVASMPASPRVHTETKIDTKNTVNSPRVNHLGNTSKSSKSQGSNSRFRSISSDRNNNRSERENDSLTCKYDGIEMPALQLENIEFSVISPPGNEATESSVQVQDVANRNHEAAARYDNQNITSASTTSTHQSQTNEQQQSQPAQERTQNAQEFQHTNQTQTPQTQTNHCEANEIQRPNVPRFDDEDQCFSDNEKTLLETMKKMEQKHQNVVKSYEDRINELMTKMQDLKQIAELLEQSGRNSLQGADKRGDNSRPQSAKSQGSNGSTNSDQVPAPSCPPPPPLPPPPPPLDKPLTVEPRKPVVKPRVKMRPLFWNRIILPKEGKDETPIFWQTATEPNFDLEEFEKLFGKAKRDDGKDQNSSLLDSMVKRSGKTGKGKTVKLLDEKRSQSVAIWMKSMHFKVEDIKRAIYDLDFSKVSIDSLQSLYNIKATQEELEKIEQHVTSGQGTLLDEPELFLYEVSQMALLEERVECLLFKKNFTEVLFDSDQQLTYLLAACASIKESKTLKILLELTLAFGNYMNGGTQRGQADGFNLKVLNKLKDVKSINGSLNLLQFMMKTYCKDFEEHSGKNSCELRLPSYITMQQGGQVSLPDVKNNLETMARGLNGIKQKCIAVYETSEPDHLQPFKSTMDAFFETASSTLKSQSKKFDETNKRFKTLLSYYLLPKDAEEMTPESFFGIWCQFFEDCRSVWRVEQKRIAREMFEKVETRKKNRVATTKAPASSGTEANNWARLRSKFSSVKKESQGKSIKLQINNNNNNNRINNGSNKENIERFHNHHHHHRHHHHPSPQQQLIKPKELQAEKLNPQARSPRQITRSSDLPPEYAPPPPPPRSPPKEEISRFAANSPRISRDSRQSSCESPRFSTDPPKISSEPPHIVSIPAVPAPRDAMLTPSSLHRHNNRFHLKVPSAEVRRHSSDASELSNSSRHSYTPHHPRCQSDMSDRSSIRGLPHSPQHFRYSSDASESASLRNSSPSPPPLPPRTHPSRSTPRSRNGSLDADIHVLDRIQELRRMKPRDRTPLSPVFTPCDQPGDFDCDRYGKNQKPHHALLPNGSNTHIPSEGVKRDSLAAEDHYLPMHGNWGHRKQSQEIDKDYIHMENITLSSEGVIISQTQPTELIMNGHDDTLKVTVANPQKHEPDQISVDHLKMTNNGDDALSSARRQSRSSSRDETLPSSERELSPNRLYKSAFLQKRLVFESKANYVNESEWSPLNGNQSPMQHSALTAIDATYMEI